jgi:hypothetical protein
VKKHLFTDLGAYVYVGLFTLTVIGAVKLNRKTADATDDDIRDEIVSWLHGAHDRNGGKSKRLKDKLRRSRETNENEDDEN